VTIASGAADYTVTFPGTFTISAGDLVAIYIGATSGSPSAINFACFDDDGSEYLPYALDFDASAAFRQLSPCLGLGLSGSSAMPIESMYPINAVSSETFQATSTPDTIGNRVTLSVGTRVIGAWAWLDLDSTATIKLYAADGVTVLASASAHTNVPPNTNGGIIAFYFTTPAEVPAGNCYIAVEATGGANIAIQSMTFPAASWRNCRVRASGVSAYRRPSWMRCFVSEPQAHPGCVAAVCSMALQRAATSASSA
jgi:hypothetical protein